MLKRLWPVGVFLRVAAAAALMLLAGVTAVPGSLLDLREMADEARQAGDYDAAAAAYLSAHRYQPQETGYLAAAVEAEIAGGAFDAAMRDLAKLGMLRPLSPQEQVWWGTIYAGMGRMDEARHAWEMARSQGGADAESLLALAAYYRDAGVVDLERGVLADWLALDGVENGPALLRLGLLQALDDPEQAAVTLSQIDSPDTGVGEQAAVLLSALEARPTESQEQNDVRLGTVFLALGEPEFAEATFARAVMHNVNYGEALAYLAYVRALLGQPSLGAAQQAAALAPDSVLVQVMVGLTWAQNGRPREARLALERAFALDSQNPALAVEIASTYRAEGQKALAELWMAEAMRLAPDDLSVRLLVAQFYIEEEYRVAEAGLPLAEDLLAEMPDSAEVYAIIGWAHFTLGEVGEAFAALDAALALDPALARAHVYKGRVLESQTRFDEAIDSYAQALAFDPEGAFGVIAARALERIAR